MPSRTKAGILLVLIILSISAFLLRLDNARRSPQATIDEWVYFGLAQQLVKDPFDYQSRDIAEIFKTDNPGLPIPQYMTKPLFKHPPLFPFLEVVAFKFFGNNVASAFAVSAFFGALMIPLGYFLGWLFFGEIVGLTTAFLLWMDPVNIICSQKVWLDTTVSFFTVLAIFLFAYAVKYVRNNSFIWAGISVGLAMLTKYTGVLAILIMVLYGLINQPQLFRNRKFLLSLLIPGIMLAPWLYWNYAVYGGGFLSAHFGVEHNLKVNLRTILLIGFMLAVGAALAIRLRWFSGVVSSTVSPHDQSEEAQSSPSGLRTFLILAYALIFIIAVKDSVFRSLLFNQFPQTSWQADYFQRHPLFYFRQLIEFSFLYFFAFMSFFITDEERLERGSLVYLSIVAIFVFYLVWGSAQSRYILAVLPFLIMTGVVFWQELWSRFKIHESGVVRLSGQVLMIVTALYIFLKVNYLNFMISYPNNMCYF